MEPLGWPNENESMGQFCGYLGKVAIMVAVIVCGLVALRANESRNVPEGWQKEFVPGVDGAWINPKMPGLLVTLVRAKAERPLGFKGATNQDIASGISGLRRVTLEQFGFRDWTLKGFSYKKSSPERVEMNGHYVTPEGARVQFWERQAYRGQRYVQVSLMAEGTTPADSEVSRILDQFSVGENP